jgi:hypothetical protein
MEGDAKMKRVVRSILLALVAICPLLFAPAASAVIVCSGPYYDSKSWNTGWQPNSGGCWLSGSICYECWDNLTYVTAGCEFSPGGCVGILTPYLQQHVVRLWLRDESGVVTAVCIRPPTDGRLQESDLV